MKRVSQIKGNRIYLKLIFFIIMYLVLSVAPFVNAGEKSNSIDFNGMIRNETKSDSMFYNDTHDSGSKSPVPYNAALGRNLADGFEVTAAGSQYQVKLIPITLSRGIGVRNGNRITYTAGEGIHVVYTFKSNGVKEDIIFDEPGKEPVELGFRLEIDPMLEARIDSRGNVLMYGPNTILSGFIQTGDEKSAGLILNARRQAPKDNLLYIIPAPVVIDGAGHTYKNMAHFSLKKSVLTIHAKGLAHLPAPVTIDPSIVVTTSADFLTGNNEGMISFDVDAINRAVPSGGSISNWTSTSGFPTPRLGHTSVAYNGYLYVIGGSSNGPVYRNDVQYAPINADGTIGSWTATTSFNTVRSGHTSVAYNGYLYVLGGSTATSRFNDVQYAPINADGTIGSWTATTSFTTARSGHTSVAYNGYLYVIGGWNSIFFNDVQYAPINADGTIGSWNFTSSFSIERYGHASVAYNGYLYLIGGYWGGLQNDVQYAPINADGTIGSWTATSSFSTARYGHTSVAYNGYLYVLGGFISGSYLTHVQYAPINANGTIGSWTAAPSFNTGRGSHTSVAYNGYLYVIGGQTSWGHLQDVQYVPINDNGTIGSWNATTNFPTARGFHTSVAYNGYLYVLGGYDGSSYFNDVQYAPINANGTISPWTATTSFTTARYCHTSIAYNGYLYVIGGYGGGFLNDVQYAPINADGTIGSWNTTTSFTTGRDDHASVAYNGYLYVIGGWSGTYLNDVQYAPINANGTIGSWTATTSFTTARWGHTSVAYSGYLYVIGGWSGSSYLSDVQFAPVNANGTIGSWTTTTSFTTARRKHTSVAYNGYLYVLGGWNGSAYLSDVQYAPINGNGTIGSWTATGSFTTARGYHTSVSYNRYLYVLGGYDGSTYFNNVQYAPINANGNIDSWNATTSFTTTRYGHTSVVYNGYLYMIGGWSGSLYLSDVQYATINGDGTIGSWTATTSFTTARYFHTSVVYNGYLYVLGGYNGAYLNDVQYAPINGDGTIGSWTATTSFTTPRRSHASVAYNGYLYVIGGWNGAAINNIQYAPINSNGTVGTWTSTTTMPVALFAIVSASYNGYLYIIGGNTGTAYSNEVRYAPINSNGTIGTFNTTTAFTTARDSHTSVAHSGYLYVIGGVGATAYLNDVQYAPINSNGSIGTWNPTASFQGVRRGHSSAEYNEYLYVLGGYNGTSFLNDVQYALFNGPAARSRYSKLIDTGSSQSVIDSISFSSSSANKGIINLTYAVAPSSTALFGPRTTIPNAASGTLYTAGLNSCARYAWVSFDLDDTKSVTIDGGGANGRKDILDFTVNYSIMQPCPDIGNRLYVSKSGTDAVLSWTAYANGCGADLQTYRVYSSTTYDASFPGSWNIEGNLTAMTFNIPIASSSIAYKVLAVNLCGNLSDNLFGVHP